MNAVGYIRCAASDTTGTVLEQMENEIRQYCNTQNIELKEVFRDNGVGGLDFERAGWKEMQEYLKKEKGNINRLVVTRLDRIGRNLPGVIKEAEKLEKEFGVGILEIRTTDKKLLKYFADVKQRPLDSLIGETVAVYPNLTTDPCNRQGQSGTVSDIQSGDGFPTVKIEFSDKIVGLYEPDALFILYSEKQILGRLLSDLHKVADEQKKAIIEVVLLIKGNLYKEALTKVMSSTALQRYCGCNFQKWMDKKLANGKEKRIRGLH